MRGREAERSVEARDGDGEGKVVTDGRIHTPDGRHPVRQNFVDLATGSHGQHATTVGERIDVAEEWIVDLLLGSIGPDFLGGHVLEVQGDFRPGRPSVIQLVVVLENPQVSVDEQHAVRIVQDVGLANALELAVRAAYAPLEFTTSQDLAGLVEIADCDEVGVLGGVLRIPIQGNGVGVSPVPGEDVRRAVPSLVAHGQVGLERVEGTPDHPGRTIRRALHDFIATDRDMTAIGGVETAQVVAKRGILTKPGLHEVSVHVGERQMIDRLHVPGDLVDCLSFAVGVQLVEQDFLAVVRKPHTMHDIGLDRIGPNNVTVWINDDRGVLAPIAERKKLEAAGAPRRIVEFLRYYHLRQSAAKQRARGDGLRFGAVVGSSAVGSGDDLEVVIAFRLHADEQSLVADGRRGCDRSRHHCFARKTKCHITIEAFPGHGGYGAHTLADRGAHILERPRVIDTRGAVARLISVTAGIGSVAGIARFAPGLVVTNIIRSDEKFVTADPTDGHEESGEDERRGGKETGCHGKPLLAKVEKGHGKAKIDHPTTLMKPQKLAFVKFFT